MRNPAGALLVFALLMPLHARADALGDVRSALASLPGRQAVSASVDITTSSHDSDDKTPQQGHAAFPVVADDTGLRIAYGTDLLGKLSEEARLQGSDRPRPVTAAVRGLEAIDVAEVVNFAPALARTLSHATLREQKLTPWQGQQARMLTLAIDVPISEKDRKRVKEATSTLTLWTTAEGMPLAAQQRSYVKVRFMLMSFENTTTTDLLFARWGDRLVAIRKTEKNSGAGMGQNFENSKVLAVTRTAG